jgi:hypothetical protein
MTSQEIEKRAKKLIWAMRNPTQDQLEEELFDWICIALERGEEIRRLGKLLARAEEELGK